MHKFFRDMLYFNNELSQERYSIFLALHFGILMGIIAVVLHITGYLDEMRELLNYSGMIILGSLGFKIGSGMLRDTTSQLYGSARGENPLRMAKNKEV